MLACATNVVVTADGLRLVRELRAGDRVLGLDRRRELAYGSVRSTVESSTEAFHLLTSSGEVIAPINALVPAIGGRRRVGEYYRDAQKQDVRVERLPMLPQRPEASCSSLGCVARMYQLLRVNHETSELRFRNLRALTKETRQELELRNGALRAYEHYMRARFDAWKVQALFHGGECRGYELLFAFATDRTIPIQYAAARQAYQFYSRICQGLPHVKVEHGYAPIKVSMTQGNQRKFDRIEGIRLVGICATVQLIFEDVHFSATIGSILGP